MTEGNTLRVNLEENSDVEKYEAAIDYYATQKNYLQLKEKLNTEEDIFYEEKNCKRLFNLIQLILCKPIKFCMFLKGVKCINFIGLLLILGIISLITSFAFNLSSYEQINKMSIDNNLCLSKEKNLEAICDATTIENINEQNITCHFNENEYTTGTYSKSYEKFKLYSIYDISFQAISTAIFSIICMLSGKNKGEKDETLDVTKINEIKEFSDKKKEKENLVNEYNDLYKEAYRLAEEKVKKEKEEQQKKEQEEHKEEQKEKKIVATPTEILTLLNNKIGEAERMLFLIEN